MLLPATLLVVGLITVVYGVSTLLEDRPVEQVSRILHVLTSRRPEDHLLAHASERPQ